MLAGAEYSSIFSQSANAEYISNKIIVASATPTVGEDDRDKGAGSSFVGAGSGCSDRGAGSGFRVVRSWCGLVNVVAT